MGEKEGWIFIETLSNFFNFIIIDVLVSNLFKARYKAFNHMVKGLSTWGVLWKLIIPVEVFSGDHFSSSGFYIILVMELVHGHGLGLPAKLAPFLQGSRKK